ncbi:MAG: hypothetical protein K0R50_3065 [Eubacterium sp.]|nr:hypothetical protein [Eubacterium sp.]
MLAVAERERSVKALTEHMVKQFLSRRPGKKAGRKNGVNVCAKSPVWGIRVVPRENISRPLLRDGSFFNYFLICLCCFLQDRLYKPKAETKRQVQRKQVLNKFIL